MKGVPTFVVGTGRCGSTMLSNMLNEHPRVLSLSEFFSLITGGSGGLDPFSPERMDGREFWSIVSAITPFTTFCLQKQISSSEWLYPFDSPAARFSRQTGVPSILLATFSLLTERLDELFDLARDEVVGWPLRTSGEHYGALFAWLAGHFGKRLWVERSGAALFWIDQLVQMFPDARFIHIVRDGRDAAISMQGHPAFRVLFIKNALAQFLEVDPLESSDRTHIDRVPGELLPFLPEQFDVEAFCAYRTPLALGGTLWSQQIEVGMKVLNKLPPDRLLTLRYEDFFANPKRQLDSFAAFLGKDFLDEKWSAQCAATVRTPRSTWRDLPEDAASALTEACRPGFELLRDAGVEYDC
jgi:Sulfotransferase family